MPNLVTFAILLSSTTLQNLTMLNRISARSSKQCRCPLGTPLFSLADSRDVAIVFHAHCLSPYRFYADMNRRGLWATGIAFPLERLYSLIANDVWSDAASEQMWNMSGKGAPYQLWGDFPASGSDLQLQDVRMTCPWCQNVQHFPLTDFTATHTTKTAACQCETCGKRFNADKISARYFRDDLLEFIRVQSGWLIPCLHSLIR